MSTTGKSYPSDVSDEQWEFLLPCLTLMREDAPQRKYPPRVLFNALRYLVRTRIQWRFRPNDFPPWQAVYQQARRRLDAGVFEAIAHDLRIFERVWLGRDEGPTAVVLEARTPQSSPESGGRAGFDGRTMKHCSEVHAAVDTLQNLSSLIVTPANEQERSRVGELAEHVQALTDGGVEVAFVDQGYTGPKAKAAGERHGVELEVVKHHEAKRGFVLLPRRWVVERTFGWPGRHHRLARDYERLATTPAGYHWVAMLGILPGRFVHGSAEQALGGRRGQFVGGECRRDLRVDKSQ